MNGQPIILPDGRPAYVTGGGLGYAGWVMVIAIAAAIMWDIQRGKNWTR